MTPAERKKALKGLERRLFNVSDRTDIRPIEHDLWHATCWQDLYNEFCRTEADGMLLSVDRMIRFMEVVLPGWYIESLSDAAAGSPGSMALIGCQVQLTNGSATVARQGATRAVALAAAIVAGVRHEEAPRRRRIRF
jgi:hypothetical protein